MKRVAILGAGDLGIQLAHHLRSVEEFQVVGFFDDYRDKGTLVAGVRVLGTLNDIQRCFAMKGFDSLLMGIGYRHLTLRQKLFQELSPRIPFATFIHPSAYVDPTCSIGQGAVIYPRCVIDMQTHIGANTLLNIGCTVAHHSQIGEGCFISPSVSIAGFVHIQEGVTLGIGTILIDNVKISQGVRTGAGAVVIHDLTRPGLYVGIPAQWKKACN